MKNEKDIEMMNNSLDDKNRSTDSVDKITLRRKRIIAIASVIITIALFLWLGYYLTETLMFSLNSEGGLREAAANFKELIESYGIVGILVGFGIQVLQVIVSPIPGGVVEIGMGLCFGWLGGSIICLLGSALASAIIIGFVKKFGVKVVELFVSTDKINELRFINNEKKLARTVFLLYLIPGTPKDPLIFFFGLTKIKTLDFVVISTLARAPSVITSAIGGTMLVDQRFLGAILIFAITGLLALAGIIGYNKLLSRRKAHKEKTE